MLLILIQNEAINVINSGHILTAVMAAALRLCLSPCPTKALPHEPVLTESVRDTQTSGVGPTRSLLSARTVFCTLFISS